MAVSPASIILASVTQGSADAWAQAEIQTGLLALANRAFKLRAIWYEFSPLPAANGALMQIQITRRSKTAVPLFTDPDIMWKHTEVMRLTTSGATIQNSVRLWSPPADVLIVEDPIYLSIDSDSTSAANSAWVRLEYEVVSITETQKLTLLARSLTTA